MELPQIVTVGIYDSRIVAKNIALSKKRKTSMFEIELPIENGGVSYVGENAKQITDNMLICAKPGQKRHTKFPFKCYYIHLIIHSGPLYDTLINAPDFFDIGKKEAYRKIFTRLLKHYNTLSADEELILQSLILELIYNIKKDSVRKIESRKNHSQPVIENALQFIKDHLTENLTLEGVAKSVSLSPIYFHNIFRTSVGITLREYIEEQRIKKATNLLLTTNLSLTQIAFECGFSSQSYFSYVFKRKMQKTPREYVKEIYSKYEI